MHPTLDDHQLSSVVVTAFEKAYGDSKSNRLRSSDWVEMLARGFEEYFREVDGYRVYRRLKKSKNRREILFDIHVCKMSSILPMRRKDVGPIEFICEPVWQVESEFKADARAAAHDFSKLVTGCAKHRLFIGPHSRDYRPDSLLPIAEACRKMGATSVYLVLVPSPEKWTKESSQDIKCFKLIKNAWSSIQP